MEAALAKAPPGERVRLATVSAADFEMPIQEAAACESYCLLRHLIALTYSDSILNFDFCPFPSPRMKVTFLPFTMTTWQSLGSSSSPSIPERQ